MKQLIQKTDQDTGIIRVERHRLNGRLHRNPSEGPAYIARSDSGDVAEERYYWHGRLHREDGPALVQHNVDGRPGLEIYCRHGVLHRDPKQGAAWIERCYDVITAESYYVHGEPYRDPRDGPWHVSRSESGKLYRELYSDPVGRPREKRRASSLPSKPSPH